MKTLVAGLLLSLIATNAFAEPFVSAVLVGQYKGPVGEPTLLPAHPVSTTTGADRDDQDSSVGLQIGYRWTGEWYAAVGYSKWGTFTGLRNYSGTDATFSYLTTNRRDEDATAWTLIAGKSFISKYGLGLFAEVGLYRSDNDVSETSQTIQTNNTTFVTTTNSVSRSSTEKDTGALYTLGWSMNLHGGAVFFMSYSKYGGDLDRDGVNGLGIKYHF